MKKIFLLTAGLFSVATFAQENTETKSSGLQSIWEINTNLSGLGVSYEHVLNDHFTLKGELSYETYYNVSQENNKLILAPSLNAEGRYYYNLEKRAAKGLNMKNNSGNFISLKAQYYGNFATITSVEKSLIRNQFTIAPMWNFSRNFGKSNFGFEWGIGAGYSVSFQKDYSNSKFFIPLDFTFSYKL